MSCGECHASENTGCGRTKFTGSRDSAFCLFQGGEPVCDACLWSAGGAYGGFSHSDYERGMVDLIYDCRSRDTNSAQPVQKTSMEKAVVSDRLSRVSGDGK